MEKLGNFVLKFLWEPCVVQNGYFITENDLKMNQQWGDGYRSWFEYIFTLWHYGQILVWMNILKITQYLHDLIVIDHNWPEDFSWFIHRTVVWFKVSKVNQYGCVSRLFVLVKRWNVYIIGAVTRIFMAFMNLIAGHPPKRKSSQ